MKGCFEGVKINFRVFKAASLKLFAFILRSVADSNRRNRFADRDLATRPN